MATYAHTTSRRRLLAAAPAALALPVVASLPPGPLNPDADLIALCASIVVGHKEMDCYSDLYPERDPPHVQARVRVLVDTGHAMSQQVADMRAATPEGIKAKARAMLSYMGETDTGALLWSNHDELLAWSIARDLLGEV